MTVNLLRTHHAVPEQEDGPEKVRYLCRSVPGLEIYAETLIKFGWDSLANLQHCNPQDLTNCGMKPGHQSRLFFELRLLLDGQRTVAEVWHMRSSFGVLSEGINEPSLIRLQDVEKLFASVVPKISILSFLQSLPQVIFPVAAMEAMLDYSVNLSKDMLRKWWNPLSLDGIASICALILECWSPVTTATTTTSGNRAGESEPIQNTYFLGKHYSLLEHIGNALRKGRRLEHWRPFLLILYESVLQLPLEQSIVYRGGASNELELPKPGELFVWPSFSLCSTNRAATVSILPDFGQCTLFVIHPLQGRSLQHFIETSSSSSFADGNSSILNCSPQKNHSSEFNSSNLGSRGSRAFEDFSMHSTNQTTSQQQRSFRELQSGIAPAVDTVLLPNSCFRVLGAVSESIGGPRVIEIEELSRKTFDDALWEKEQQRQQRKLAGIQDEIVSSTSPKSLTVPTNTPRDKKMEIFAATNATLRAPSAEELTVSYIKSLPPQETPDPPPPPLWPTFLLDLRASAHEWGMELKHRQEIMEVRSICAPIIDFTSESLSVQRSLQEFLVACGSGDMQTAHILASKFAEARIQKRQFLRSEVTSGLCIAVQSGDFAICEMLLQYKADVNCVHEAEVRSTIDFNEEIDKITMKRAIRRQSPLLMAASKGEGDILRLLILSGANPNIQSMETTFSGNSSSHLFSPLHFVVSLPSVGPNVVAMARMLLFAGANPHACSAGGSTSPLAMAPWLSKFVDGVEWPC